MKGHSWERKMYPKLKQYINSGVRQCPQEGHISSQVQANLL